MGQASIGLRARLMALVLAAVIPAFGLIDYMAIAQRGQAATDAEQDAMTLVRLAAREQSELITAAHQLLMSMAQLPSVRSGQAAACSQTLAQLLKPYRYYTNFGAAAVEDGQVFCSARPLKQAVSIADRSYFQRAVQARDFAIGDYQIGRITGINAINLGYPVIASDGTIKGVVFAALNLSWLEQLAAGNKLPDGSTITVVDSHGTVLAHYPGPRDWVGKSMRNTPLISTVLSRHGEGWAEVPGLDGVRRLYAFAPLLGASSGNVFVTMGIPKAVAFGPADRVFEHSMILLLLVAVLVLAAAWVAGDAFVLRRVNALAAAARRLGAGDHGARTGLPHGPDEMGQLARNFDDMAAALQKVNRALKTLSAGNRALVRATDEQALLGQMCRIIVEVGCYRCACVAFSEQDEGKTVRLVAQAGFAGGLEALAATAGEITWADTERGSGPAATAIRTGRACVMRNLPANPGFAPWKQVAERQGYASAAAFPLHIGDRLIGALTIYSHDLDAFDSEEMELLGESADDLSFGIAGLRTRAEHEQAHQTIRRMAYYDGLTGLPNHVQFEERLHHALVDANGRTVPSLALLLLDLDRFREINDALGFKQGDLLLKDVGRRLREALREVGLIARMRGDEFAVLLSAGDAERAEEAARRILRALETPFALGEITLDVSAAVGIALCPQHGSEAARLVRHMDVAMRVAKKSGERYAFYSPEQDEDSARRLTLARELRHAIEEDGLLLYYQPKIDMREGRVCGVEALARWRHPQHGMIPPDEFIPLAEHTGLIKPLTDWVLKAALRQSATWRTAGLQLPIAVNLSARNLREADLLDKIRRLLAYWDAQPDWLELEITESAIMDDPRSALDILTDLNDLGIALFIDDFGTGYSSFSYLQRLPVDGMKIDKSFVKDMLASADSAAIVRSTVALAHDLGISVVAEGVENQEMWNRLAELDCDIAQGYHIGRPAPAQQFEEWLEVAAFKPPLAGRERRRRRRRAS